MYEKLERMLCDGDFIAAASSPTDCGAGTGSIMGRVGTSGDINKVTTLTGEVHNIVFAPCLLYFAQASTRGMGE